MGCVSVTRSDVACLASAALSVSGWYWYMDSTAGCVARTTEGVPLGCKGRSGSLQGSLGGVQVGVFVS